MARDPDGKLRARLGPGPVTSEAVVAAARDGDPFAEELLAEMGAALGTGLADLAAVLDPAIIIIGGGLGSIGEPLLRPARMAFTTARYAAGRRPEPPIVVAAHGVWAGAIGAALLPDGEMRT
jgi:glucokinase